MKVGQEEKEKEAAKVAKQTEMDSKKEVKLGSRPVSTTRFATTSRLCVSFNDGASLFFSFGKKLLRAQEEQSISPPAGEPGLVDRHQEPRTAFAKGILLINELERGVSITLTLSPNLDPVTPYNQA